MMSLLRLSLMQFWIGFPSFPSILLQKKRLCRAAHSSLQYHAAIAERQVFLLRFSATFQAAGGILPVSSEPVRDKFKWIYVNGASQPSVGWLLMLPGPITTNASNAILLILLLVPPVTLVGSSIMPAPDCSRTCMTVRIALRP